MEGVVEDAAIGGGLKKVIRNKKVVRKVSGRVTAFTLIYSVIYVSVAYYVCGVFTHDCTWWQTIGGGALVAIALHFPLVVVGEVGGILHRRKKNRK